MSKADMEKDGQKALEKLVDKKIVKVSLKSHDEDCWRMHIDTDKGRVVLTYCKDWKCPIVEYREH